jgi:hypothetical protein
MHCHCIDQSAAPRTAQQVRELDGVCIRRWSRAAKASRVRRVFESRVSIAPHLLDITVCSMVAWLLELMLSELASVDISPGDAAT